MKIPHGKIQEGFVCAEIGVWKGDGAISILKRNPKILHLIDPWIKQNYKGRWYGTQSSQSEMDEIYKNTFRRFQKDKRVKIHRNFSTKVKFPEKYFDWIYVDGNHSCEMVSKDLAFYFPLMKTGGLLCGDDYGWADADCKLGPKVAVDKFVSKHGLDFDIHGTQYIIYCDKS